MAKQVEFFSFKITIYKSNLLENCSIFELIIVVIHCAGFI